VDGIEEVQCRLKLTPRSSILGKLDVHEYVHRDIIIKTTNNIQLYRLIYYS